TSRQQTRGWNTTTSSSSRKSSTTPSSRNTRRCFRRSTCTKGDSPSGRTSLRRASISTCSNDVAPCRRARRRESGRHFRNSALECRAFAQSSLPAQNGGIGRQIHGSAATGMEDGIGDRVRNRQFTAAQIRALLQGLLQKGQLLIEEALGLGDRLLVS